MCCFRPRLLKPQDNRVLVPKTKPGSVKQTWPLTLPELASRLHLGGAWMARLWCIEQVDEGKVVLAARTTNHKPVPLQGMAGDPGDDAASGQAPSVPVRLRAKGCPARRSVELDMCNYLFCPFKYMKLTVLPFQTCSYPTHGAQLGRKSGGLLHLELKALARRCQSPDPSSLELPLRVRRAKL